MNRQWWYFKINSYLKDYNIVSVRAIQDVSERLEAEKKTEANRKAAEEAKNTVKTGEIKATSDKTPHTADTSDLLFDAFILIGSLSLAGAISYRFRFIDE